MNDRTFQSPLTMGTTESGVPASTLTTTIDDYLVELQGASTDEARHRFFLSHTELASRSTVETLSARATSLLRVDPREAEHLIEAAMWLAEELDDDFSRGKARRARANLAHIRGNESEALFYYASARSLFAVVGADLEAAITASSSIQSLVFQGKHDQALKDVDFARAIFERHGDRLRLARLNSNYANLLFHRDRWAEAARYYEAAHRDFLEVGEKQDVAVCLGNMAVCHLEQQDFAQALEFYKRTRSYCEQNGLGALTADLDYNIAYLHYLRGQYTTALELYREARARHSELGDQHHVDLCALNEAEIYLELNLTGECADLAALAYSGFCDRGLTLESAKALTILAIAESRQGKAFLALELLSKAQEAFRNEKSDRWDALVDLYRATVFSRAGRPFESRRLALRADVIFQRFALTAKSVACRVLLGRLALQERTLTEARALCMSALETLRRVDSPALHFQACCLLGDIERAAGDVRAAVDGYLGAHEQLARISGAIQTDEQRIQAVDDKLVVYENLVELLALEPSDDEKAQLFSLIEKAKSRGLTDLLAFRAYALPETQPGRSKLADQVRQLREELNWYYRQIDLQEMRTEDRSPKDVEALRRYSRQQETRLIRTLNLLEQTDQEFSSVQEAFSVEVPAIRMTLPANTTLVEYYVANGTVIAVVLDSHAINVVPTTLLSTVDELRASLAASLSRNTSRSHARSSSADKATLSHLAALYTELIEPIAGLLSGDRLLIVPHGSLFYLPFHAFRVGQTFLSERYSITYTPSSTAFHLARLKAQSCPHRHATLVVSTESAEGTGADLGHRLQQAIPNSVLLEGPAVSEEELAAKSTQVNLIHLQTTAQLRQDNPMFSTITLGTERIHLFDLFQLKLDVDLVTVAGCAPGVDAKAKGNEMVGLVRGLLYAGARSVLTTLWDVDNDSWLEFSSLFYGALESGRSRYDSLQLTTSALRTRSEDPLRWAPFVLFGDAQ